MTLPRALSRPITLVACVAVAALTGTARADRVRLKTGETVVGRIVADASDETMLVVEDYVAGGRREFDWDTLADDEVARCSTYGRWCFADDFVRGERIVRRSNVGTAELCGVVEKEEGGFLFVRNASSRDPLRVAAASVVSREPIEMAWQEVRPVAEVFEARKAELNPIEARDWFRLGTFGERIGAWRQAKEAFEAAASDVAFRHRRLALSGVRRSAARIATDDALGELGALRVALAWRRWPFVRDAIDTFGARHAEAGEAGLSPLAALKAEFATARASYFAAEAGMRFEKIVRRRIDAQVLPRGVAFNDVQAWIRSDATRDAMAELHTRFQARDPAVTAQETRAFFDARPGRTGRWRRANRGSGSFIVGGVARPPTRDAWWASAPFEERSRFWWAVFVEKSGLYEVRLPHERVACVRCDGTGKLSKRLAVGGTLEYVCDRCGGARFDEVVVFR